MQGRRVDLHGRSGYQELCLDSRVGCCGGGVAVTCGAGWTGVLSFLAPQGRGAAAMLL